MWKWKNPIVINKKVINESGGSVKSYEWQFSRGGTLSAIGFFLDAAFWDETIQKFVIGGGYDNGNFSTIITSPDGFSWAQQQTNNIQDELDDVAPFHPKYYWLAVSTTPPSSGHIWRSTQTSAPTGYIKVFDTNKPVRAIAYNNTRAVVVGYQDIWHSSDGSSWTTISNVTTTTLNDVVWNGSIFCAVGNGGVIYTSPDGLTWTQRTSNTSVSLQFVKWDGSKFIAGGANGTIVISPNGITWTVISTGIPSTFRDVEKVGDTYFITGSGQGGILTTKDFQNFTRLMYSINNNAVFGKLCYSSVVSRLVITGVLQVGWGDAYSFILTLDI